MLPVRQLETVFNEADLQPSTCLLINFTHCQIQAAPWNHTAKLLIYYRCFQYFRSIFFYSQIYICQPLHSSPDSCLLLIHFIAYCLLFIVYCLLFNVYCLLFIVYCLLFIVYCLLFIAYCLLLIVYCLLLIAYCLLFIASYILLLTSYLLPLPSLHPS